MPSSRLLLCLLLFCLATPAPALARDYTRGRYPTRRQMTRTITSQQLKEVQRISGTRNPASIATGMISRLLGTSFPGQGTIYLGQTLRFVAPLEPGARVTARVRERRMRDGRMRLTTSVRDARSGRKLVEGVATVLPPGVKPGGGNKRPHKRKKSGGPTAPAPRPLRVGPAVKITDGVLRTYAGATGDRNPLHLDSGFAAKTIFGRRIAHGMLGTSMIYGLLDGMSIREQSLKFRRPVFLGDTVSARLYQRAIRPDGSRVLQTELVNQDGKVAITGEVTVAP